MVHIQELVNYVLLFRLLSHIWRFHFSYFTKFLEFIMKTFSVELVGALLSFQVKVFSFVPNTVVFLHLMFSQNSKVFTLNFGLTNSCPNYWLQIITLSASANRLSRLKEQAEEYAALIMEELDPEGLGYIEVGNLYIFYYKYILVLSTLAYIESK